MNDCNDSCMFALKQGKRAMQKNRTITHVMPAAAEKRRVTRNTPIAHFCEHCFQCFSVSVRIGPAAFKVSNQNIIIRTKNRFKGSRPVYFCLSKKAIRAEAKKQLEIFYRG